MRPGGMGVRPGGVRPGLGPRFNFQGMRPLHSPRSDTKRRTDSDSSASQPRDKCSEGGEDEAETKKMEQRTVKEEDGTKAVPVEETSSSVLSEDEAGRGEKESVEGGEVKQQVEVREEKEKVGIEEDKEVAGVKDKEQEKKDETNAESSTGESNTKEGNKSNPGDATLTLSATEKKAPIMSPEQMEKYRCVFTKELCKCMYIQSIHRYHQHMMALQHQRREAMSRGGYPFPPPPGAGPPQSEEAAAAAAAYYGHHHPHPNYGAGYPPNMPHSDPRQMELAAQQHHYWMEMEARRRYSMMKQAQHAHHSRRQQQQKQQKDQQQQQQQQQQPPRKLVF